MPATRVTSVPVAVERPFASMQAGARARRDRVAAARAQLQRTRGPYRQAADELLDLTAHGAPSEQIRAARGRMWDLHRAVARAQAALRDAETPKRRRRT